MPVGALVGGGATKKKAGSPRDKFDASGLTGDLKAELKKAKAQKEAQEKEANGAQAPGEAWTLPGGVPPPPMEHPPGLEVGARRQSRKSMSGGGAEAWQQLNEVVKDGDEEERRKVEEQMRVKHEGKSAKTSADVEVYYAELRELDELTSKQAAQLRCHEILSNSKFDMSVGVIIFANSVTMGMEIEYSTEYVYLELFYLAVYTTELSLRFFAHGRSCLDSGWVRFDALLVSLGIVFNIVSPLATMMMGPPTGTNNLEMFAVLKVLRLMRLARAVRLLAQFKALWLLVRGLLGSGTTMMYTFLILFGLVYVFACLALEVITKNFSARAEYPIYNERVEVYFSNLPRSMLTLVQFLTLDSIGTIYAPLIICEPTLAVYFVTFLLVCSIAMMNLVTAVIVQGSLEQAETEKDVAKAYKTQQIMKLMPGIRAAFLALDEDGSGELTLEEVMQAPDEVKEDLSQVVPSDDLIELFEMLDSDGGGSIDVDEFVDGLTRIVTSDTPLDVLRTQKQLKLARTEIHKVEDKVNAINQQVTEVEGSVDRGFTRLAEVISELGAKSPAQPTRHRPVPVKQGSPRRKPVQKADGQVDDSG
jgi:voltage-gated sodium channel